jgi:hypothetical protein
MRAVANLLPAALLVFGAGGATIGCSSHTTTTTRTVEGQGSGDAEERTETTTTEKEHGGPGIGILSGTIHAIGFILALPFKIVGGLLEIIF